MAENDLPPAVQRFIDATNAADTETFVTAFTDDAHLDDWGRGFDGHDGIRSWNETDNIGKRAHFDLVDFTAGDAPDSYVVTLTVSGGGYNGTGSLRFQLREGRIARLDIS